MNWLAKLITLGVAIKSVAPHIDKVGTVTLVQSSNLDDGVNDRAGTVTIVQSSNLDDGVNDRAGTITLIGAFTWATP